MARFMVTLDGNKAVRLSDDRFAYSNSLTRARQDMLEFVRVCWRSYKRTDVRHGNGKVASSYTLKDHGRVMGELRIVRFENDQKYVLNGDGFWWGKSFSWTKDLCEAKTFDTREEAVAYRSANRMFECEVRLIDARTVVG